MTLLKDFFENVGKIKKIKNATIYLLVDCVLVLCPEQDSNLHGDNSPQGPQPCVSTNSTTWANNFKNLNSIFKWAQAPSKSRVQNYKISEKKNSFVLNCLYSTFIFFLHPGFCYNSFFYGKIISVGFDNFWCDNRVQR